MSLRKTIFISDRAEEIIGQFDFSLSGRIGLIIEKYGKIIQEAAPELTTAEWDVLRETLHGRKIEASTEKYLWADIQDKQLAEKVRGMSVAARCYIIDIGAK